LIAFDCATLGFILKQMAVLDRLDEEVDEEHETARKVVFYAQNILAIVVYFVAGITFYVYYEKWSVFDAVYFTIVTISTVGYGDLAPSDDNSRLFTIVYIVLGIYLVFNGMYYTLNHGLKWIRNDLIHRAKYGGDDWFSQTLRSICLIKKEVTGPTVATTTTPDGKTIRKPIEAYYLNRKLRIYLSIGAFVLFIIFGAVVLACNEGMSFISGLFFAVETSTVSNDPC
jgi:voltage-gated potassium channel